MHIDHFHHQDYKKLSANVVTEDSGLSTIVVAINAGTLNVGKDKV